MLWRAGKGRKRPKNGKNGELVCFSEFNRSNAFVFAEVFDEVGGFFKPQIITYLLYAL
jgi:hypothetical protein